MGSSGAASSSTLAGDTDVQFSALSNNDVVTYEAASGKWKNKPGGGGTGASTADPFIVNGTASDLTNATQLSTVLNQGLLSARPAAAAGNKFCYYWASDTAQLYQNLSGTAWSAVSPLPGGSPASGDLTGTYPNPTLVNTGPGATGPIGDSSHVAAVTIDAKGRVTALTSTAIGIDAILPSETGQSGKFLTTNGTTASWGTPAGGSTNLSVVAKTANYTATTSDDVIDCDASGGAFTISVYTAVGNTGKVLTVKKTDSSTNAVTIDPNSTETIDGALTVALITQGNALTIVSDGTNWRIA